MQSPLAQTCWRCGVFWLLVLGAVGFVFFAHEVPKPARFALEPHALALFDPQAPTPQSSQKSSPTPTPTYSIIPNPQKSAHASTIVALDRFYDRLQAQNLNQNPHKADQAAFMALFFAGSREGASDVGIYQSFFTPHAQDIKEQAAKGQDTKDRAAHAPTLGHWSHPRQILTPSQLSRLSGKFIAKLGNPISFIDTYGRAHVFVVGVSLGGWATSRIYWLHFDEQLEQLHFRQELTLSPFANFSHLVRTPAMRLEGGGFILPVYHELARKYPLLLHFNANLELESKTLPLGAKILPPPNRILASKADSKLQPSFVALSPTQSLGVYRNYVPSPMLVSLCDGTSPMHCSTKPSNLTNSGSSSVLFTIGDQVFLLHNDKGREELWIYALRASALLDSALDSGMPASTPASPALDSGGFSQAAWDRMEVVEFVPIMLLDSVESSEVSYPSLDKSDKYIHIAYTYKRAYIKTALLSRAALYTRAKSTLESNAAESSSKRLAP